MARHAGAKVAVVVIALMVLGSVFFAMPEGQKALSLGADVRSNGLSGMLSPQGALGCSTGGCGSSAMGMSLFG